MKDSFAMLTQWKNKAETSDTLPINNVANRVAQFDIDISNPLVCLDFMFTGRLNTLGGGQDPSGTLDTALRMFTMSMWIERENGNYDMILSGTPLYQVYRLMNSMTKMLQSSATPGGFANEAFQPAQPFHYLNLAGATATPTEDYAFHLPIYFGFLSSVAEEYKAGIFMPRSDFRSLKVQFNNIVETGGTININRKYPFPNSNNTYTFTGFGGAGVSQVQCFITQADPSKLDPLVAGSVLPVIRSKPLNSPTGIAQGGGILQGLVLDKWDRGILWQALAHFEETVTAVSGRTTQRAFIPNTVGGGATCTILRDITMYANSQRLMEWNNLLTVLRQNTYSGTGYSAQDASPSLQMLTKNGQFQQLGDLRRFFKENDTVILQYDNVQDPGTAGTAVFVDTMVYGYQQIK